MMKSTILLVEDEASQRQALTDHLAEENYEVISVESAEKALSLL